MRHTIVSPTQLNDRVYYKMEPGITIEGAPYEDDTFSNTLRDFDFQYAKGVGVDDIWNEEDEKPKKSTKNTMINEMGLPTRIFMGEVRPHFEEMDDELKENLRLLYSSEIKTIQQQHPDVPIPNGFNPDTAHLDALYTVKESGKRYSTAVSYAGTYKTMFLVLFAAIEGGAHYMGFKAIDGITAGQKEIMDGDSFKGITVKMATEYGGGPVEGLPIIVQAGFILLCGAATQVGLNMLEKKIKGKGKGKGKLAGDLVSMVLNSVGGGPATTPGKKKQGGMQDGIMGVMGPIMQQFMGGNGGKKKKKKGKQKEENLENEEVDETNDLFKGEGLDSILSAAGPFLKGLLDGQGGDKKKNKKIHIE